MLVCTTRYVVCYVTHQPLLTTHLTRHHHLTNYCHDQMAQLPPQSPLVYQSATSQTRTIPWHVSCLPAHSSHFINDPQTYPLPHHHSCCLKRQHNTSLPTSPDKYTSYHVLVPGQATSHCAPLPTNVVHIHKL